MNPSFNKSYHSVFTAESTLLLGQVGLKSYIVPCHIDLFLPNTAVQVLAYHSVPCQWEHETMLQDNWDVAVVE